MTSTSNQQPHVVQAIFDSLTRCFNPIGEDDSPFPNRCPRQSPVDESPKTTTHKKSSSRRSNSSGSSSNGGSSSNTPKSQYDADRYLHRKLAIFRTNSEDLAEMGIERRPNTKKQQARRSQSKGDRSANTLVYSFDDEIANLTKDHKRAMRGCGIGGDNVQDDSPVARFVKLLRDPLNCITEAQKPFGLCFATPIRTASVENVANLSDWKLTAEEFAARQRKQEEKDGEYTNSRGYDMPDIDASSASLSHCEDEEETITSASYFDQKYSHIVEENPPMPLFLEQRIAVSEFEMDELFKMVKRREAAGGTGALPRKTSSRENNAPQMNSKRRTSPVKKNSSAANPRTSSKSRSQSGKSPSQGQKTMDQNRYYGTVPVAKSSSVSTQSDEDDDVNESYCRSGHQEQDMVHSTAAEI